MRKIILFLALALGVEVNAQVVGGYIPINSSKTPTMGGLRVTGNETVVGTLSVGSTATVTGALKASSTMSLGSANLTGGSTGTVAVLSDAMSQFQFMTYSGASPSDASSYYFDIPTFNFSTTKAYAPVYIAKNITIIGYCANFYVGGTLGSSESVTLAVDVGTVTTNLNTSMTWTTAINTYTNFSQSINVNGGDYIEAKIITPTWATNPTGIFLGIVLYYVRRT